MAVIEKIRSIYRKIKDGYNYYNEFFKERLYYFP
jgi:hypothetical protein